MTKPKKAALIIGISDYQQSPLPGAIVDAHRIHQLLRVNDDGSVNYDCKLYTSPPIDENGNELPHQAGEPRFNQAWMRGKIKTLFGKKDVSSALFYFSGHGSIDDNGGYLVCQDAERNNVGFPFRELIDIINASSIPEIIIMLDCCYAGDMGNAANAVSQISNVCKGITILTASGASEVAVEQGGKGLFTDIICSALKGEAANILGEVSVASVYNHLDKLLGAWDQRPHFKAHLADSSIMRMCTPPITIEILRNLTLYFKGRDHCHELDKSYEDTEEPSNPKNEKIFKELQKLNRVGIVKPLNEEHMYLEAVKQGRGHCCLTDLGKFYYDLVEKNRI